MPNYEYSFSNEVARFYGLNTNCPFSSERLRKKLNQNNAKLKANMEILPWLIAVGHHPIYSNGTYGYADLLIHTYWN